MDQTLAGRRVLLIISGGIAAYKSLDLIRRLRERGAAVRCVMTAAAQHFVSPLAAASLAEDRVYTDLWSLTDESEMGHIRLSREADLLLVAPATADLMAKMAAGMADDLATTTLLATDKPIMLAPSMNVMMWLHTATQANLALLERRSVRRVGPDPGALACGEVGSGRMAEPLEIVAAVEEFFREGHALAGKRALVTSGPTWEPIDPVRFLGNRSSGKQGHAIAAALAMRGAAVTLVSGPTHEPTPSGVTLVPIETAREMLAACEAALPVDIAVFAAAVSDWRTDETAANKLKKTGGMPPKLHLVENPDVLATIAQRKQHRPALVIGFAAETENVVENAIEKRRRKGCDWLLANDVSATANAFGNNTNTLHLVTDKAEVETWADLPKTTLANRLADRIAGAIA